MSSPTISGTLAGQTTNDQDTIAPFAGVTITDNGVNQTETVTVSLSNTAAGTFSNLGAGTNDGSGVYTIVGDAASVSSALDSWIFSPAAGTPGSSATTSFNIAVLDTAGYTATDSMTSLTVNSGPAISGTQANQAISDQTSANPFAGVTITDDPNQTETVTVVMSSASNGTLSDLGTGTFNNGTYTVSGTSFAVTSALNHLVFTPAQGTPGNGVTTGFTITDTDTANVAVSDSTTTVIATGGPAISGTLPDQQLNDQSTVNPFANVTIADDAGQTETVAVSFAGGNGTLSQLSGGSYNPASGTYSISGTAAAVTAALQGLVFTPTQGTPGQSVTTAFTITDTDTAGAHATDTATSVVVSSGPTITGTIGDQTTTDQGVVFPFAGVMIADDAGQIETVTIQLSDPANGVLSNTGNGTFNQPTGTFTDSGSAAQVTSDIDHLAFTPALGTPGQSVTTTFTITDTDTANVTISDSTTTVIASAGPAISGTVGGQTTTDGTTVIPFGGVTITDNPGQTETVTIELSSAANGSLSNLGNGSYNAQTGTYTDTGLAAAVTNDIDQLVFTPATGTPGETTTTAFTISDTDGAGVTVTDSATTLTVTSGPSISGAVGGQTATNQAAIQPFSGVIITDNVGQTETVTVALSAANGTLTNLGTGTFSNGVYTAVGDATTVTSDIDQLLFVPAQGTPGQSVSTIFTIAATDTAGYSTTNATTSVTVASGPVISGTATGQTVTNQGTITPFANVTISDSAQQTETVTVSFNAANGTFSNLGNGSYNAGVYTDTGIATAVSQDLQGLVFTPVAGTPGQNVTTTFTISDTDSAAVSATGTATVTNIPGPAITGTAASQQVADGATITPFAQVVIADDVSQTETVAVSFNAANGALSNLGNGSYNAGVYTDTGTATAVTQDLKGLVFTPVAGTPGQPAITTTFTIAAIDSSGAAAQDQITTVSAESGPAISGTAASQQVADSATITPFAHVVIADDVSQTETVTVTLSNPANGTLGNPNNDGSYNAITGVYTDTGSAAAVTQDLQALVFTPVAGTPGQPAVTTTFTISAADTIGLNAADSTTTVSAESGPAITGTAASQQVPDSATINPFAHVVIADDAGQTETVTVRLSNPANGTLSNLGSGSYNAQTGTYTDTGLATAVTAALHSLVFTPASGTPGQPAISTTFTISATDTIGLNVTDSTTTVAAEPGPAITGALTGQSAAYGSAITPLASIAITDDVGQTETVTVTLSSPANGSLVNLDTGSYNAATGVYTVIGSAIGVTSALDGLTFAPAQNAPGTAAGTTSFAVQATDSIGLSSTGTASVQVQYGPAISGSVAGQGTTDTSAITPFAHVLIADDGSQNETVTVTLSDADNGTLSNPGGDGSYNGDTGVYSISGSASTVTAALDALVFTPAYGTPGAPAVTTTFTIATTDTAGLAANDATTTVSVLSGPAISGAASGQSMADTAIIAPLAQVAIADDGSQTDTVTVTLSNAANGTLSNPDAGSYNAQTGVYTVSGSADAVTAALQALVFTPTGGTPGAAAVTTTFTVRDTDTAGLHATSSAASVLVQSGPAVSGIVASQTVLATATLSPFSGVSVADDGSQTDTATVTLASPVGGTLSDPNAGSYNAQTGVYTVSGSADAVTAALQALVFTPNDSIQPGQTIATGFTLAVQDSVGLTGGPAATSVLIVDQPPVYNDTTSGTSFVGTYNPQAGVSEVITEYSGLNGTGSPISKTVDNTAGTSLLYAYNPTGTASLTATLYTSSNDTGSKVSEVVDETNGQCLVYAYNPSGTVTLTSQTWSATNPANGAPAGAEISDVVDNADGTSLLYTYNPSSTVIQTAAEYSATDPTNGAPSGNEISDVVDNTDGTSILYAYNPASNVLQTATFYSSTDPTSGAPAGTITSEAFDYTNGESAVTTNNQDGSSSTLYYSGPDGTGSQIPGLTGTAAGTTGPTPAGGLTLPATASQGTDTIAVTAASQLVDPGTGIHTIQFAAGAASDTLMLHLGATDQVQGFDLAAGDMISLGDLLTEAHVSLGNDMAGLGNYVSVTAQGGAAAINFDPTGHGGGSPVALLLNDAAQVPQLQALKAFTV